jgi:hypothetical protein
MAKAQPLIIGDLNFRTKLAAREHIRSILYSVPVGQRVPEPHESFLRDLAAMHPRPDEKFGVGIDHFKVGPDNYNGICFHLFRTDGTHSDFSFKKCLDGEENQRSLVTSAMRTAIRDQIVSFRTERFISGEVRCPYNGTVLTTDNCHVDHAAPNTFYVIIDNWLAANGVTVGDVAITPSEDNVMGREMTNSAQIISWAGFHKGQAVLRITSVLGNLSNSKIEGNRLVKAKQT